MEEYDEERLIQEYEKVISNPSTLKIAIDHVYETLIEDLIMSLCLKAHFESKHPVS